MPVKIARGERVAFSRGGDIYIAAWPDIRVARRVGQGQDPNVSQAGNRATFEESSTSPARSLVVVDAATGKTVLRRPGTRPALSPTGAQIAFSEYTGGRWRGFVADVEGGKPRPLSSDPLGPAMINGWVNQGAITAHSETLDKGAAVFAVSPDGKILKRVGFDMIAGSADLSIPLNCAWSDDLRYLAYESNTDEEAAGGEGQVIALFAYDTVAKRRRRITPKGYFATQPHWYGPGTTITFTAARNTTKAAVSIYGMDINAGAAMQPLIPGADTATFGYRGE